jgi:hypothetical protein
MALATSSLPVPVSPEMRTVDAVWATSSSDSKSAFIGGEEPTRF